MTLLSMLRTWKRINLNRYKCWLAVHRATCWFLKGSKCYPRGWSRNKQDVGRYIFHAVNIIQFLFFYVPCQTFISLVIHTSFWTCDSMTNAHVHSSSFGRYSCHRSRTDYNYLCSLAFIFCKGGECSVIVPPFMCKALGVSQWGKRRSLCSCSLLMSQKKENW